MSIGSNTPVKSQGRKNNPDLDKAGNLDHTEEMEHASRLRATYDISQDVLHPSMLDSALNAKRLWECNTRIAT
ncbi:hypothetical protein Moror_14656 [Moniliophthora roreri MCA 2997]|uniref:Uncharacterized protein n=2 Tax=Moniliophthora roreri TaxID=221103 RepID=V2WJM1_MONRO|nr:hypothetical protein Moror_14656 [Moniliophthora roreri MCA 2997]